MNHQEFIERVAHIALSRLPESERAQCEARITYGAGQPGLRGVTYYGAWQNGGEKPVPFVEVCAFGEESPVQLIGTTIHELGHVLAGPGAGHGKDWKAACERLGLRKVRAAGTSYCLAMLAPDIREQIARLPSPEDGEPIGAHRPGIGPVVVKPKPCPMGTGTRGGKSRGKGSGSRMRKFVCQCDPPIIVRAARDELPVTCDCCGSRFEREEAGRRVA